MLKPQLPPEIGFDDPTASLWKTVKLAKVIYLSKSDLETKLGKKLTNPMKNSPQYPFLILAITKAAQQCGSDVGLFHSLVEEDLSQLFPKITPKIPFACEAVAFLTHAAVYGKNCCPRKGLTLIDEYLDLSVSELNIILGKSNIAYLSKYRRILSGNHFDLIEEFKIINEFEFNKIKYELLREVISIASNSICKFPGIEIMDLIIGSLDNDPVTILSKKDNFLDYMENSKVIIPVSVQEVIRAIKINPVHPDQYHDLINRLQGTDGVSDILIHYLHEMHVFLVEQCTGSKSRILSSYEKKSGVIKTDCEAFFNASISYLFTDKVLAMFASLYPDCQVEWVVNYFLNSKTCLAVKNGMALTCTQILGEQEGALLAYLQYSCQKATTVFLNTTFQDVSILHEDDRERELSSRLFSLTAQIITITPDKNLLDTLTGPSLLMRRYRFQALNHMMYRETQFIDPVISDTLCELRPPFLMDCDLIIQGELQNYTNWQDLVKQYNMCFAKAPLNELSITTPFQLIGEYAEPYEYLELCWNLERALQDPTKGGKEYFPRHLAFCKTMTRSSFLIRDRLGIEMGEFTISNMRGNENRRCRSEMGTYNIWYTQFAAQQISQHYQFFNETLPTLVNCHVVTPDNSNSLPLVPIFQAQAFALLKAFQLNRPLIVRLKRIHILSRNGAPRQTFVDTGNNIIPEDILNAEYQVVGSQVLVYMPNSHTGCFDLVQNVPNNLENVPGFAVSAYSILDLTNQNIPTTEPGYGGMVNPNYYLQDVDKFFEFIKTQDILNLLNICSANHPVFVPNARELTKPLQIFEVPNSGYQDELVFWGELETNRKMDKGKTVNKTIPDQFVFLKSLYGRPNDHLNGPCNISFGQHSTLPDCCSFDGFCQFYRAGEILIFANRQYKSGVIKILGDTQRGANTTTLGTNIIYRCDGNMPFYSIHIYCSTYAAELQRSLTWKTDQIIDRFEDKDEMSTRMMQWLEEELLVSNSMKYQ